MAQKSTYTSNSVHMLSTEFIEKLVDLTLDVINRDNHQNFRIIVPSEQIASKQTLRNITKHMSILEMDESEFLEWLEDDDRKVRMLYGVYPAFQYNSYTHRVTGF